MKIFILFAAIVFSSVLTAADKRVKDLTKTATVPAANDYLVLDGATEGTRKILANNIVAKISGGAATYGGPTAIPVLTVDANGRITAVANVTTAAIGGGSGTVTSISAGDLAPLFTTTETGTSTPAITFVAATQAANRVYAGPTTGSAAAPTFRAIVDGDLPATGITAATYGNATHTPQIVLNANGRVTSVSNIVIAPTGMVTWSGLASTSNSIVTTGNITANVIVGSNLTVGNFTTTNLTVTGNLTGYSKEGFIRIDTVADAMNRGIVYVPNAVTVRAIRGVHTGSGLSSPSIVATLKHGTDRTSGTTIEAVTVTSSTTGTADDGTLSDATVPAGSFIWVETSGKSGTTADFELAIRYTND